MDLKLPNIRQCSVITKLQSDLWGYNCPIAFNYNGQKMASGQEKNIKIWHFCSKLKQLRKLRKHKDQVCHIIFSSKRNWFVSGDWSGFIICWNNEQGYQAEEQHHYKITHFLLNKNEDELITCSDDKRVKVWKVNYPIIQYQYDFNKDYTDFIVGITMNDSENYLVTCTDRQIVLWKKCKTWRYQSDIFNNHKTIGAFFISDSHLIWEYQKTMIKPIIDSFFLEILEVNSDIDQLSKTDLKCYFNRKIYQYSLQEGVFYNAQKKFVIIFYGRYVFILKQQINNEFKAVGSPIDCLCTVSQGVFTQDGEFMILQFLLKAGFKIYKIS